MRERFFGDWKRRKVMTHFRCQWQYHAVVVLSLFSIALESSSAQQRELRGVWYTPRTGSGFVTQSQIAAAMDTIANNNFNTVFFLVWSQGYPLWRSRVFFDATGGQYWTDPRAGNRDLLGEAIVEAHRRGLEIEGWFEYGFVGGFSGNRPTGSQRGPLLDANPAWRGRSSAGSDSIAIVGRGHHYWMSHLHSGVQRFLIDLVVEMAVQYDLDGIELDRIRYPQLDWGYDSATVALYRAERGTEPPGPTDASWKKWRADKLSAFHKAVFDSVKRRSPAMLLTNAPSHYAAGAYSAYENFLQDWAAWVNDGYLDVAHLQMYVNAFTLNGYISYWKTNLVKDPAKQKKIFPGIAVAPDNNQLPASEFLSLIDITRSHGLLGNAIWYFEDLNRSHGGRTYWAHLKSGPYRQPAIPPYRSHADWRQPATLINEYEPTQADTTGQWVRVTSLPGYFGPSLQAGASGHNSITYYATVGKQGWYDFYAYIVGWPSRTTRAPFDLFDSSRTSTRVTMNQSDPATRGWVYLGSRYLRQGERQRVLRLSNEGIEPNSAVAAGGAMLILNRRLSPDVVVSTPSEEPARPEGFNLYPAYPNPFNSTTAIEYQLASRADVSIDVFDTLGRKVESLVQTEVTEPGFHRATFEARDLTSGVYFVRLMTSGRSKTLKVLLIR